MEPPSSPVWTPWIDSKSETKLSQMIDFLLCGEEALSPTQQLAFTCIEWKKLMETPRFVGLPAIIYFEPKKGHNPFPTGKLWGVLMTFMYFGSDKRPRTDGIVFVCGNQWQPPPDDLTYSQLFTWATNYDNCPSSLRFHSLAYALTVMCGTEQSPYRCRPSRSDGYFQGVKCWTVLEWEMTIEELLRCGVDFLESSDTLPASMVPEKPKKTRKKRKKPADKDTVQFLENLDIDSLIVPSLFSSQDDSSSWH